MMKRTLTSLGLLLLLPMVALADVELPGFQQLGDNSHLTVTYDQLRESPFYVSLTDDITLASISLSGVSGLEPDSSLVYFIDGIKVATGTQGSTSVPVSMSLTAGYHTLALRGSCYSNGVLAPCSGGSATMNIAIADLSDRFVDPVTHLVNGDLNNSYTGSSQTDAVEITGDANRSIDLRQGADRLYIHGSANGSGSLGLGNGDDVILIGGDKNVPVDLGQGDNHLQVNGSLNSGAVTGGNQDDTLKVKGEANYSIELNGGNDQVEILQNMNGSMSMGIGNDQVYIHGDVNGTGISMGGGSDILRVDGSFNSDVDGGGGNDTLYVNMTEAQWAGSWQKGHVRSFETIICTDTVSENVDEDDFSFTQITLHTADSLQTSDSVHFIQKYHLGDNRDNWDGYDLTGSDLFYPDSADGTSKEYTFDLQEASTHLKIEFYRVRELYTDNPISIDGTQVGSLSTDSDRLILELDGSWSTGAHQLRVESERVWDFFWYEYDDFSWDQVIITPTTDPEIDHFKFIHDGEGITCMAEEVRLVACANSDCSLYYNGTVHVKLSNIGWLYGREKDLTFPGTGDGVILKVQHTTPGYVVLGVESSTPAAQGSEPVKCDDGKEASCQINFSNAGIVIDGDYTGFDDESPQSDVVTQIAGKSSMRGYHARDLRVWAVKTDPLSGACVAAVADKTIPAWASYQLPVFEEGLPDTKVLFVGEDSTSTVLVNEYKTKGKFNLAFDDNGTAPFAMTFADCGRYTIQINLNLPVVDESGDGADDADDDEVVPVEAVSNPFVVRPLAVFADAPGNPKAQDVKNNNAFWKAGEDFTLNFKVLAWATGRDGNNNGLWDNASAADLKDPGDGYARVPYWNIGQPPATVVLPAATGTPVVGGAGTLTYAPLDAPLNVIFSAGNRTLSATANFDEVGVIQFPGYALDFLGEDVLLDSPYIGRFYPHHFKLTPGVLTNRVDLSCTTAATTAATFTYLGENLQLTYRLTAKNALGATTLNYDDRAGFGRFIGDTLLPATELADYTIGALDDPYGTPTTALSERINIVSAKHIDGWLYGRADFTVVLNVARLADVDGPFPKCYFGICLQDLDGVQIASSEDSDGAEISAPDLDMDQDTVLDHTLVVIDPTKLRYGRMVLENAYGSELLDLPMTMQAEYWTGVAFTRNLLDSCTLYGETALTLDNDQVEDPVTGAGSIEVGTQATTANITNQPLLTGDGGLFFNAPGAGGDGWVNVELEVDDYLKYNWHNSGDENPRSRATFGIYKGSDRIIFLRETGW